MTSEPSGPAEPGAHYFRTPKETSARQEVEIMLAGREVTVTTAGGVFSGDRLDLGTRVLLREVPAPPPEGDLLDLGCGWGPIALTQALHSPQATVWAVDVNELALELTGLNARRAGASRVRPVKPDQVPDEVRFAAIWSNPPIRVGKPELHAMLLKWLPRLLPEASAHLVVQRNLGADSLHGWLQTQLPTGWSVVRAGSAKGYRVLRVTAAASN
ncbi:class I SAM-dependent methyltransferase [Kineosporia babensis]|uniref:Class I SAM-dependent methyltransferase n=1 Tax=Kineosporia babensis TaxID=499548 RepID=A0A9X1NIC6_9ACTN|nr:methyltransferase [Kineosporia babensis]MCD5314119.1 class I SAM-dependent methyltransferase [Kineosporia babensis]